MVQLSRYRAELEHFRKTREIDSKMEEYLALVEELDGSKDEADFDVRLNALLQNMAVAEFLGVV